MSSIYNYSNKGKKLSFDTKELTPTELESFKKMSATEKRRFIESHNLEAESPMFNEIQIKSTTQYKPQNEKYNQYLWSKMKKEELTEYMKAHPELALEKVGNIKNDLLQHTKYISINDLNDDMITLTDLQKQFMEQVKELENISSNVNILNKTISSEFSKLKVNLDNVLKAVNDPLKGNINDIINKYNNDLKVLEALDKNKIDELINLMKEKNDTQILDNIDKNINRIKTVIGDITSNKITTDELVKLLSDSQAKQQLMDILKESYKANMDDIMKEYNINVKTLDAIKTTMDTVNKTNAENMNEQMKMKELNTMIKTIYDSLAAINNTFQLIKRDYMNYNWYRGKPFDTLGNDLMNTYKDLNKQSATVLECLKEPYFHDIINDLDARDINERQLIKLFTVASFIIFNASQNPLIQEWMTQHSNVGKGLKKNSTDDKIFKLQNEIIYLYKLLFKLIYLIKNSKLQSQRIQSQPQSIPQPQQQRIQSQTQLQQQPQRLQQPQNQPQQQPQNQPVPQPQNQPQNQPQPQRQDELDNLLNEIQQLQNEPQPQRQDELDNLLNEIQQLQPQNQHQNVLNELLNEPQNEIPIPPPIQNEIPIPQPDNLRPAQQPEPQNEILQAQPDNLLNQIQNFNLANLRPAQLNQNQPIPQQPEEQNDLSAMLFNALQSRRGDIEYSEESEESEESAGLRIIKFSDLIKNIK
jgi:hypothetical protein